MFSETVDERGLARLRADLSWILLCQQPQDLSTVEDLLTKAYTALQEIGVSTDLAYCETELARYHLANGDPTTALSYADRSIERITDRDILESARVRVVRAYVLAALGDTEQSLRSCRQAMQTLRGHRRWRQYMATWREAAELLVRLGRKDEAIDAYRALADCGGAPEPIWTGAVKWAPPSGHSTISCRDGGAAGGTAGTSAAGGRTGIWRYCARRTIVSSSASRQPTVVRVASTNRRSRSLTGPCQYGRFHHGLRVPAGEASVLRDRAWPSKRTPRLLLTWPRYGRPRFSSEANSTSAVASCRASTATGAARIPQSSAMSSSTSSWYCQYGRGRSLAGMRARARRSASSPQESGTTSRQLSGMLN